MGKFFKQRDYHRKFQHYELWCHGLYRRHL